MPDPNRHDPAPPLGLLLTEPARGAWRLGHSLRWLRCWPVRRAATRTGCSSCPASWPPTPAPWRCAASCAASGTTSRGWALGRNVGPTARALDGMPAALDRLAQRSGGPVSVVGWSLGGIFAASSPAAVPTSSGR